MTKRLSTMQENHCRLTSSKPGLTKRAPSLNFIFVILFQLVVYFITTESGKFKTGCPLYCMANLLALS